MMVISDISRGMAVPGIPAAHPYLGGREREWRAGGSFHTKLGLLQGRPEEKAEEARGPGRVDSRKLLSLSGKESAPPLPLPAAPLTEQTGPDYTDILSGGGGGHCGVFQSWFQFPKFKISSNSVNIQTLALIRYLVVNLGCQYRLVNLHIW